MTCDPSIYSALYAQDPTALLMANGRHSFVAFYPSDWMAGTMRMPRLHRSVYFDICCYIWDTAKPVPALELELMLTDLADAHKIVQDLLSMGKIERLDDGSISNPKALAEAEKAFNAWSKMSAAGKGHGKGANNGAAKGAEGGQGTGQQENQNQNQTSPNGDDPPPTPSMIVDAWKLLAERQGLPSVSKMTDKRKASLKARIEEHGIPAILKAIATIEDSDFLLGRNDRGWKANFDWLLQPSSMTKLIEGAYHGRTGKRSAWLR